MRRASSCVRFGHGLGREVVDHEDVGLGAGGAEGASAIVLAVVAGENRDDHARAREFLACIDRRDAARVAAGEGKLFHVVELLGFLGRGAVGEDALDAAFPCFLQLGEVDLLGCGFEHVAFDRGAQGLDHEGICSECIERRRILNLNDEAAVHRLEKALDVDVVGKLEADLVAHAHLEEGFSAAAVAGGCQRQGASILGEALDGIEDGEELRGVGAVVVAIRSGGDAEDRVPRALEFRGDRMVGTARAYGEAHEGGRYVEVLERARHGVLAADGANAKVHLRHERAEYGCCRLAPALRHVAQALEVLLEGEVGALAGEARGHEAAHALND